MKLRTTPLDYIHQELFATFDERPRRCDGLISVFAKVKIYLTNTLGKYILAIRNGCVRADGVRQLHP